MIRLDKYLADMNIGTRSEVKNAVRKGLVTVNGEVVRDSSIKVDVEQDMIHYAHQQINYVTHEYFMLNKPAGVLSATRDRKQETVLDLITDSCVRNLFPVGRLDKDTEGLLLITNDGMLAHRLLSPSKHVGKTYYAKIDGLVTNEDIEKFRTGILLHKEISPELLRLSELSESSELLEPEEDFTTLPAELTILTAGSISEIEVTIYEGKFHQVKRMFEAVGKHVLYLKRLSMGSLTLDAALKPGEYRALTDDEISSLIAQ
ncbi:MAG TPA: pseudouridine synthase [Lachnospiraceae bacterium]|nr:pseudouridine synthase [Lachnospiraceae bacterium]